MLKPYASPLNPDASMLNPNASVLNPYASMERPDASVVNPEASVVIPEASGGVSGAFNRVSKNLALCPELWTCQGSPRSGNQESSRPGVKTTMIYTHVLNRRGKGVQSPLDLL